MIHRRDCLAAASLGTLALFIPQACRAEPGESRSLRALSRQANDVFDRLARQEFASRPELATQMGIDMTGALSRLDDRSQAGFERARLRWIENLGELEAMPLAPAGHPLRRDQAAIIDTYRHIALLSGFGHGRVSHSRARPYVIDQLSGGWREVPELLITRQPVANRRQAIAYLRRLSQLADTLDDERRRLEADARTAIVPPDFILETTSARITALGAPPAETHPLVISFEDLLTGARDLGADDQRELRDMAIQILRSRTLPAYQRLAQACTSLRAGASNVAGVWALPEGEAYYDALLAFYTRPGASARDHHREGEALVETLSGQLDTMLREDGLTEGPVGQRLAALSARADQQFADNGDGRRAFLAELDRLSQDAARGIQGAIARMTETPLAITTLPDVLEDALGGATYRPATADATRPGTLYVSAGDPSLWPRFALPAFIHHHTVPGHHTQTGFALAASDRQGLRRLSWPAGFVEGWAAYAETLADDAGLYDGDRLARIGYLQSQLLHAARLVADTGLHKMRWTRQEAVDYLVETVGLDPRQMAGEVDRMIVWPGQATSAMAGRQFIMRLRERAEGVLGDDFDPAAFHHTVLSAGPRPLDLLQQDLESWYEAQIRRRR